MINQPNSLLKTRDEIAQELGVSTKTIYRRLKDRRLTISRNKYLSAKEQETIYTAFDLL